MYRKAYVIPVNVHADDDEIKVVGKRMSPMPATVERAKSGLRDDIKGDRPRVVIKRSKQSKTVSVEGTSKGSTANTRNRERGKRISTTEIFRQENDELRDMAYLSEKITDIGLPSELNIFTVPPNYSKTIENISECRPVSTFDTADGPVEISIPGQGGEYIYLRRSRLYGKIVKEDGTNLADTEKTGIINMPLQTMWSQIDTYMNGNLVSLNTSNYSW